MEVPVSMAEPYMPVRTSVSASISSSCLSTSLCCFSNLFINGTKQIGPFGNKACKVGLNIVSERRFFPRAFYECIFLMLPLRI